MNEDKWEEYMELNEERVERTGDAWDEIAERFFEENGWTQDHMAYDNDRETKTLWVLTQYDPEVWEDTGIPYRNAEWLLCDMWDEAEYIGYEKWLKEQG